MAGKIRLGPLTSVVKVIILSAAAKEMLESGFFQAHHGFAASLADGLENMFLWSASNRVVAGVFAALFIGLVYAGLGSLAVRSLKKRDL